MQKLVPSGPIFMRVLRSIRCESRRLEEPTVDGDSVNSNDKELINMSPEELIVYGFSKDKLTPLENEVLHRYENMVERYESDDLYGDDTRG